MDFLLCRNWAIALTVQMDVLLWSAPKVCTSSSNRHKLVVFVVVFVPVELWLSTVDLEEVLLWMVVVVLVDDLVRC